MNDRTLLRQTGKLVSLVLLGVLYVNTLNFCGNFYKYDAYTDKEFLDNVTAKETQSYILPPISISVPMECSFDTPEEIECEVIEPITPLNFADKRDMSSAYTLNYIRNYKFPDDKVSVVIEYKDRVGGSYYIKDGYDYTEYRSNAGVFWQETLINGILYSTYSGFDENVTYVVNFSYLLPVNKEEWQIADEIDAEDYTARDVENKVDTAPVDMDVNYTVIHEEYATHEYTVEVPVSKDAEDYAQLEASGSLYYKDANGNHITYNEQACYEKAWNEYQDYVYWAQQEWEANHASQSQPQEREMNESTGFWYEGEWYWFEEEPYVESSDDYEEFYVEPFVLPEVTLYKQDPRVDIIITRTDKYELHEIFDINDYVNFDVVDVDYIGSTNVLNEYNNVYIDDVVYDRIACTDSNGNKFEVRINRANKRIEAIITDKEIIQIRDLKNEVTPLPTEQQMALTPVDYVDKYVEILADFNSRVVYLDNDSVKEVYGYFEDKNKAHTTTDDGVEYWFDTLGNAHHRKDDIEFMMWDATDTLYYYDEDAKEWLVVDENFVYG